MGRGPIEIAESFAEHLAVEAADRDRDRAFPTGEIDAMRPTGLFALRVPREAGGGGGSIADYVRVVAALATADSSVAQMYITHTYGVELLNEAESDPNFRAEFYRRLVEEGLFIGNGHSERGTKTIFDFKTRLDERDDGSWVMNGKKFYGTGSGGADVLYISGKVEGGGVDGSGDERRDLGEIRMVFLERDTPGLTIYNDWDGMGQRTTASGTIELDNVLVPTARCLRTEGFDAPESLFSIVGQAGFAAVHTGVAEGAFAAGVDYVKTRSRPWPHAEVDEASHDPYVISHIGRMRTEVSQARAMLDRACAAIDEAERAPSAERRALASVRASEAKAVATEAALDVSQRIFQVAGAGATVAKYNLDRFWRDTRTLTVHDPVDYKYRLIGNWALNGVDPPVTSYT